MNIYKSHICHIQRLIVTYIDMCATYSHLLSYRSRRVTPFTTNKGNIIYISEQRSFEDVKHSRGRVEYSKCCCCEVSKRGDHFVCSFVLCRCECLQLLTYPNDTINRYNDNICHIQRLIVTHIDICTTYSHLRRNHSRRVTPFTINQ